MSNSAYLPDGWSLIKLSDTDYRVFSTFRGGYVTSDSWRVNAGVTYVGLIEIGWVVSGDSGTTYYLDSEAYNRHSAYTYNVLGALCIKNGAVQLSKDEAFDYLNEIVLKSGNGG